MLEKSDYLILRHAEYARKFYAVQVEYTDVQAGNAQVLYENTRLLDSQKRELLPLDTLEERIIANLGKNPPVGSVYGCAVTPYHGNYFSKKWGNIHFYVDLSDDEWEVLKKVLIAVYKKLPDVSFLPLERGLIIRPNKGKTHGSYYFSAKKGDCIELTVPEYHPDILYDVLYHECGHGMYYRSFDDTLRSDWISLYLEHCKLSREQTTKIDELFQTMLDAGSIEATKIQLDDWDLTVFNEILRHTRTHFSLSKTDIDVLLANKTFLRHYLPSSGADIVAIDSPLGEYSAKNPQEFWSEAFRLFMQGKLPKDGPIYALMVRSTR